MSNPPASSAASVASLLSQATASTARTAPVVVNRALPYTRTSAPGPTPAVESAPTAAPAPSSYPAPKASFGEEAVSGAAKAAAAVSVASSAGPQTPASKLSFPSPRSTAGGASVGPPPSRPAVPPEPSAVEAGFRSETPTTQHLASAAAAVSSALRAAPSPAPSLAPSLTPSTDAFQTPASPGRAGALARPPPARRLAVDEPPGLVSDAAPDLSSLQHALLPLLETMLDPLHHSVKNVHLELLRQMHIQRRDLAQQLTAFQKTIADMSTQMEELRQENMRLRQMLRQ